MDELTDPAGIAALSAGALALISLLLGLVLAFRVRRLRAAQRAVLGEHGQDDLVAHAAGLHQAFAALHERVEEVATPSTSGSASPRNGSTGRSPTARWCATTPTAS